MLCPTIAITFISCTNVNLFTLSHHESYEVNLLPTTRLTSNSKTIKLHSRRGLPKGSYGDPWKTERPLHKDTECVDGRVRQHNIAARARARVSAGFTNPLLDASASSTFHYWCHGGHTTRCFTRLYEFQWIYQWDGRMEVCLWPGRRRIALLSKLRLSHTSWEFLNVRALKMIFSDADFLATRKPSRFSGEELLLR